MNPKHFETDYKNLVQFDQFFGLELEVHEPGQVTYTLTVKPEHATKPDQAHGGVIAAMMDAVLGLAALSFSASKKNMCSTVEFKLNYLSPARPGETLIGTAGIDHAGQRLIVASGEIKEKETGRLVAKGMGTFNQYPREKR